MSRRPSRHATNKAKLTVSNGHKSQCERILREFVEFIKEPWAADAVIMDRMQSASNGPVDCDPVTLLVNGGAALLSIFLTGFIVTLRLGVAALKKKYGDKYEDLNGVFIDMRLCDNSDLFLAAGTYKGYVASLIAGINRGVFDYIKKWKTDNIDKLANAELVPIWVINPPQIDIENGGQWIDVHTAQKTVLKRCHNKKGV